MVRKRLKTLIYRWRFQLNRSAEKPSRNPSLSGWCTLTVPYNSAKGQCQPGAIECQPSLWSTELCFSKSCWPSEMPGGWTESSDTRWTENVWNQNERAYVHCIQLWPTTQGTPPSTHIDSHCFEPGALKVPAEITSSTLPQHKHTYRVLTPHESDFFHGSQKILGLCPSLWTSGSN